MRPGGKEKKAASACLWFSASLTPPAATALTLTTPPSGNAGPAQHSYLRPLPRLNRTGSSFKR